MWLKWNGSVLSFQSRAFVSLVCAGRCVHYGNPLEGLLCSWTVVQCIYSLSCALCFCCTVQVPFLLQQCHADVVLVSGLGVTPEGLVPQSILYCGRCWCSLVQLLSASCANIRLGGIGRQTSCCYFWASKQQLFLHLQHCLTDWSRLRVLSKYKSNYSKKLHCSSFVRACFCCCFVCVSLSLLSQNRHYEEIESRCYDSSSSMDSDILLLHNNYMQLVGNETRMKKYTKFKTHTHTRERLGERISIIGYFAAVLVRRYCWLPFSLSRCVNGASRSVGALLDLDWGTRTKPLTALTGMEGPPVEGTAARHSEGTLGAVGPVRSPLCKFDMDWPICGFWHVCTHRMQFIYIFL